jgi:hypothetical protein
MATTTPTLFDQHIQDKLERERRNLPASAYRFDFTKEELALDLEKLRVYRDEMEEVYKGSDEHLRRIDECVQVREKVATELKELGF